MDVSIIVCTRNRAESLRETLASIGSAHVPSGWKVELLIVDNGSSDHTREVAESCEFVGLDVRIVEEVRPGVSNAKNTALRLARGHILLFTDDDVRVPREWITGMAEPIQTGRADAVAGGVVLAPHLKRDWQDENPWITSPLATTAVLNAEDPKRLVGANMALARRVFDEVAAFDVDLGPGSDAGLGEETLLTLQLRSKGFRVVSAFDIAVEHHCAEDRLSRSSYLEAARKIGRSQGFIDYHWKQAEVRLPALGAEIAWLYGKLLAGRLLRYRQVRRSEGLPGWEMVFLTQIHHRRQLLAERGSDRKYAAQENRLTT